MTLSHTTRIALTASLLLAGLLCAPSARARWSKAAMQSVSVNVEIARQGDSKSVTEAVYVIEGGRFHGFDLAAVPGATLVPEACEAKIIGGFRRHLAISQRPDGSARVLLADKESVSSGTVVFTVVHRIDFAGSGALRNYAGRARFDWTPIIWDQGLKEMNVSIALPGESRDAGIVAEKEITSDYEIVSMNAAAVSFKKHRAPRWYPMQILIDFDAALVNLPLGGEAKETAKTATTLRNEEGKTAAVTLSPLRRHGLSTLVALLGFIFMLIRSAEVRRAFWDMNLPGTFRLLPHTGLSARLLLSTGALFLGIYAGWRGVSAAAVPAFFTAATLWIPDRVSVSCRPRPGGEWRQMTAADIHAMETLIRSYDARRRSWLDAHTVPGALFLFTAVALLSLAAWKFHTGYRQEMFRMLLNGVLWIVPVWFSFKRAALPIEPVIENFRVLKGWRRSLVRLIGRTTDNVEAVWWIREDANGPLEIRLRIQPPPSNLTGLEVATDIIMTGNAYRVRTATILRMIPGTPQARLLAACPGAAEHHLTPDLREEIIVLRDRRGQRDGGLKHLRAALAMR
jgi:hypothetical protein